MKSKNFKIKLDNPINPKNINHDYKSTENLIAYYDFKTRVSNKIFDVSENENHIFSLV